MSLIFGICLPRKVYLVSDSRLTSSDGSYEDNFAKWLDLNPRLSVIVANSAYQASWLLRKIIADVRKSGWDWDFTDLEDYLGTNLKKYATEYYAETGETTHSVNFIFGGFEKNKKLAIETARMGEAMSMPVRQVGEGVQVNQTIDMDIINAFRPMLDKAAREGRMVEAGTMFEVNLPKPRVLAVSVRATDSGAEVNYEDTACFDGVVFNPQYKSERVVLPSELLGNLEYRDKSKESGDDTIYIDYGHIIKYVRKLLEERHWPTVGGETLPLLVLPNSSGFAVGQYIRRSEDGKQTTGGIGEVDGKIHYYDPKGKMIPYRFVYEYINDIKKADNAKL